MQKANGIEEGDKVAFQIIISTEGDIEIADDETDEIFIFELDDSQTSFSVEGEQLTGLNAHLKFSCFCADVFFHEITEGCMQGEKQEDGSWFVQAKLQKPDELGGGPFNFELYLEE